MADAQADNAQGQPAPPEAPKTGDEPRVPQKRLDEVVAERNQTRDLLAQKQAELAAAQAQLAELRARAERPADEPPPEDEPPEKTMERVIGKVLQPYQRALATVAEQLDEVKFAQSASGLDKDVVAAAEKQRQEWAQRGIVASRADALRWSLGDAALRQRQKAAEEEAARIKANAAGFQGEEHPGAAPPPPTTDIDRLPPAERAKAYADRLGDTPI